MAGQKSQIIANAQAFTAKGKFDKAIAEWRKLVSETPQDGNIYNTIADLYLRINDKDNAIETCLKAAAVYKETGFELKGVAVLKKILKIDSNRIDIYERLADINAERGLTGSAIDAYQQTAKLYVQRSNFKAAISVYRKLLLISPEDPDIHMSIARLFQKQEQYREAILSYEQAAVIYENKRMVSEARQVTEEILKIDPSYLKYIAKKEASVAELDSIVTPKDMMLFPPSSTHVPQINAGGGAMASSVPVVEEYEKLPSHGQEAEPYSEVLPFSPSAAEAQTPPISFPEEYSRGETIDGVTMAEPAPVAGGSFLGEFKETAHRPPTGGFPLFEETGFSSPQPQPTVKMHPEDKKSVDVSEIIFQAHLAEVDVYLRYGLNQNAIDRLLLAKELVPTREEPYIRLREIYLKEGQNEKAAEMGMALARLHEQRDGQQKKDTFLAELQWKDQQAPHVVPESQVSVRKEDVGPAPYDWSPVGENEVFHMPGAVKVDAPWGVKKETVQVQQNLPPSGAGMESGGEDGYFDLASAVVNEFNALTDGSLIAPPKDKDLPQGHPAKSGYDEKRQQYIESCHHLGIVHKEMGNYEKAVREFEQALPGAGAGRFREILVLLAACYVEAGYIAKAIEILQNGMHDPRCEGHVDDQVFIQYELASYFEQLGDREKSYALYKEIYRVRPQFKDVSGKVKEIPYRKHGDIRKERYGVHDLPIEDEVVPQEGVPHPALIKEKRRISYV